MVKNGSKRMRWDEWDNDEWKNVAECISNGSHYTLHTSVVITKVALSLTYLKASAARRRKRQE